MITREEYLKNPDLHNAYYTEIAKEIGISPPQDVLAAAREAFKRGDEHLNSIPLWKWDIWAYSLMTYQPEALRRAFEKRGDQVSRGGVICVLKTITSYYIKQGG